MKKVVALLLGLLLLASVAVAEEKPVTIQSLTDLAEVQEKLDQGATIEKVYYTHGYGFSTGEFTTDDPEEIALLWNAVNAITVGEKIDETITDWYPQIIFYLSDGTEGSARFEGEWLQIGGMENYEIGNADEFWNLTASLVEKHARMEEDAVPGGWNDEVIDGGWGAASDPAVTEEIRALFDKGMEGLVGVDYVPVTYLGSQVVAGFNHAILCQATAVYPGAYPHWVIVYLYEDLEGNVSVTDIMDLNW